MTPEEFETLVRQGDMMTLAEAIAPLNESQRKKLSKTASRLYRSRFSRTLFSGSNVVPPNQSDTVELSILAVGSLSQARKISGGWDDAWVAATFKVMSDRRPVWIDQWIESNLQGEFPSFHWKLLRSLIKNGICRKPECDGYFRCMARGVGASQFRPPYGPISQSFVEEPDLLDDVWRLFEIDTGCLGDDDPKWYREAPPMYETLATALVKLSEHGHLDRKRLIDACLKAIHGGFKDQTLTRYMRFHEALQLTAEELATRQPIYIDLLANCAPHVVTFALERLRAIERSGRLDGEAFLVAMVPAFQIRTNIQPRTALQIVSRVTSQRPELVPQAVAGVLEALTHPGAEVHQQAIGLIESWVPRLHPDHAAAIRERLEEFAPLARSRAEKVASQLRPAATEPTEQSTDEAFTSRLVELAREAETLSSPWRARVGVNEALESLRAGRMPGPLQFDLLEARVLTGIAPIEPIQNVDELMDAVAHAVETLDSADELERILDGISRLCDQRPPDLQRRTDPLVKRMMDSHAVDGTRRMLAWDSVSESVYQLLMVWLCKASPSSLHIPVAIYMFFDGRVQEVIHSIQASRARSLLAAPTHQGGWIDPVVLVQRLTGIIQGGDEPGRFDLIQALLRLAPDNREQALQEASDLPGHVGRAVRWALGSQECPCDDDGSHTALWLAAGRSRSPTGTLDNLPILKIGKDQPDAFLPCCYVWRPNVSEGIERGALLVGDSAIGVTLEPEAPFDGITPMWPTVALHQPHEYHRHLPAWQCGILTTAQIGMIAHVWPLCLDPFLVGGIHALARRIEMPASTLAPNRAYLQPWFEPDRPWNELAALAVWIGLVSKDAGSRTTALDVLIQAIGDGRAHPQKLADVLAKMLPGYWVKLNRVADAMAEAARMSCAHAWFAADMLQHCLAGLEELPRDAHFILSLLHELLTDLGMPLAPETRRRLETIQGTTKTAKAAIALRKLELQPQSAKLRQAGLEILEARIARAKRWSGMPTLHSSTTPSRAMP